jgi:maltooligosyltrehalose trehalohydrolase
MTDIADQPAERRHGSSEVEENRDSFLATISHELMGFPRRRPIGAEIAPQGGVDFRVWAPGRHRVVVQLDAADTCDVELASEPGGYFAGRVAGVVAGARYCFRLDDDATLYPDPASRYQPMGPHGPSQVIDPTRFAWSDDGWCGVKLAGQVVYELHVGTFTQEGTWSAASDQLEELAALGVTLIELMPIAEFPGRFGWGYDGVNLFAPAHVYGEPDDLRGFVDQAHACGVGVILDVVYNHFGPDGNYLRSFSSDYFTDRYKTDWGEPLNFDGPNSESVREFFLTNAAYWIEEFHFDGFRLDATQSIFDVSRDHIIAAIGRAARAAAGAQSILLFAEHEGQDTRLVRPLDRGGYGLDAIWNDDFHHTAVVAMTGRSEAYYTDYLGTPQELVSAVKWGYLYQGQRYGWQEQRRGSPTFDLPQATMVQYLQNHDQIANSSRGLRMTELTSPGRSRALTALMLLTPGTPLLFQGQEFAASSPFLYFAHHGGVLAKAVRRGRGDFLTQFPSIASPPMQAQLTEPSDAETFTRCKLDFSERVGHAEVYTLHHDLLALRRADPVLASQDRARLHGAVLGDEALVLRFFGGDDGDRLLLINLGRDLDLQAAPEPLLAPPLDGAWEVCWSSEDPIYGGGGTPAIEVERLGGWHIPGHAAVLLASMSVDRDVALLPPRTDQFVC